MKIIRIICYSLLCLLFAGLIIGNVFYIELRQFIDHNFSIENLTDEQMSVFNKVSNQDYTLSIYTDKDFYQKFEKITIYGRIVKNENSNVPENSVIEVQLYSGGNLIKGLDGSDEITLIYNKEQKVWSANWYPEGPEITGDIEAKATGYLDNPESQVFADCRFLISETPSKYIISKGMSFLGIDFAERISKQSILSLDDKVIDWNYIPEWVNIVSADGILMLGGVTQTYQEDTTLASPWYNDKIDEAISLGNQLKQNGKKLGIWIRGLNVEGIYATNIGYRTTYSLAGDHYYEDKAFISLLDDNRKDSIVKLMTTFMQSDVVSYVGLSDIFPSQMQGIEMIDYFFRDFNIDVPSNWSSMDFNGKFQYFLDKIKDKNFFDNFESWKEYVFADYLRDIINKSGHNKPIFYYMDYQTLSDNPDLLSILMNSGIDFVVLNFNLPFKDIKNGLANIRGIDEVSRYFDRVIISYELNNDNVDPSSSQGMSSIENYSEANIDLVKYSSVKLNANGIMFNDLRKVMYGKRGPYSPIEWMYGIGESIYRFKKMNQVIPFDIQFNVPDNIGVGDKFIAKVDVVNISPDTIGNFKIDVLPIFGSQTKSVALQSIPSGKDASIDIPLQFETNNTELIRKKGFISFKVSWSEDSTNNFTFTTFKSFMIKQAEFAGTNSDTNSTSQAVSN